MRTALVSDIHGNLAAFEVALRDVEARGADRIVCLGDVVGYGPDPEACVALVRERCAVTVRGNHDDAVARGDGTESLPPDGQTAARRHRAWLGAEALGWLAALPLRVDEPTATFVHAAPQAPETWQRLTSYPAIRSQFEAFAAPVCFVGHSHKPAVASDSVGVFRVRPGHRFLVDVGSVGQPRDHDPRLSYALYDDEAFTVETVRLHYDVARTVARVHARGLPDALGARLARGV